MFWVKGAVATGVRKRESVHGDDENGLVLKLSGAGILVRIADNSGTRRELERFADANSIVLFRITPAYKPGGKGRNAGGKLHVADDGRATTARADYECVGGGRALRGLAGQPFVAQAEDIVNVHVPFAAAGSGEEKPRPPMGTGFGKPAQIAATAAQLTRDMHASHAAARKAGTIH